MNVFTADVEYVERGFLRRQGRQHYRRHWNAEHLQDYSAQVTRMQSLRPAERGARVSWAWSGRWNGRAVSADVASDLRFELASGRIERHSDACVLHGAGRFGYRLAKLAWLQEQRARRVVAQARCSDPRGRPVARHAAARGSSAACCVRGLCNARLAHTAHRQSEPELARADEGACAAGAPSAWLHARRE